MLSRFLDKKNQSKGVDSSDSGTTASLRAGIVPAGNVSNGQGSLLDLMGPTENAAAMPGSVSSSMSSAVSPPGLPLASGSGSLLTDFNNVEVQQRQQLHQQEVDRTAHYAAVQQAANLSLSPPGPDRQQVNATSSDLPDKAQQLDFLADELTQLKSKLRSHSPLTQEQNQEGVDLAYRPESGSLSDTFSFDNFVGSIVRSWKLVLLCAMIGVFLAAVYSLTLPDKYQSTAVVLIEPRGLKVLNNSVSPNGLNSEATVAYAESQVRILTSSSVIDPVIDDLELIDDPEFNGSNSQGAIFGVLGRSFGNDEPDVGKRAAVKRYLHENLFVRRVSQTFTIEISVSTTDPAKSARIANALARSYIADETGARSTVARSANEDLTSRLDELRQQVRINEEKVEQYKAANGLVDANGRLVSDVQLSRLNEQLVLAKVQTGDARTRAKLAAEADLGDVISGSIPSALNTSTVNQLRLDYSRVNARLEKLATKLGQRHPDRIAATSERRSVLNAISQELKRVVQTAQENFKRAKARQDDLAAQVTQLKAAAVNDSAAKVKLRELSRQVEASRQIYEAFLLRSRETGAQENIRSSSARIISEAVPIAEKTGPMRKMHVILGGATGVVVGMMLALIPLVIIGFQQLLSSAGGSVSSPSPTSARPVDSVGDLYSSDVAAHRGRGQLPLPGLTGNAGISQPASSDMALRHAPHRQAAPPMYYENWRK